MMLGPRPERKEPGDDTRVVHVGTRVRRKRDGATGVVVNRFPDSFAGSIAPASTGAMLLSVRLDDPVLAQNSGGDMTGDPAWLTAHFTIEGTPMTTTTSPPLAVETTPIGMMPSADWDDFEVNLASILQTLEEDQFLVVSVKGDGAYVQFVGHGAFGVLAEMISNHYLSSAKKFTADQIDALVRLGWNLPTGTPHEVACQRLEAASPNFFRDFDQPVPAAEVARLAVRSLRDVAGVRHPGLLEYTAFDREGCALVLPTLKVRRRPKTSPPVEVRANTVERVRVRVLEAIQKATGDADLEFIEGRHIQLRFGSAILFVRVHKEPLRISVASPVLTNVDAASPTVKRLNELNAKVRFARFFLEDGTIYAVEEVSATPFVSQQVLDACARLGSLADDIDDVLQHQLGGRTAFGEFRVSGRVH